MGGQAGALPGGRALESPQEAEQRKFVSVVLADTEETWRGLFAEMGRTYEEPKLVLFTDAVDSACGFARRPSGRSTAPPTGRFTSTSASTGSSRTGLALRVISPRPT